MRKVVAERAAEIVHERFYPRFSAEVRHERRSRDYSLTLYYSRPIGRSKMFVVAGSRKVVELSDFLEQHRYMQVLTRGQKRGKKS
jgi:hypothetical protein